jgi:hypothetical protein
MREIQEVHKKVRTINCDDTSPQVFQVKFASYNDLFEFYSHLLNIIIKDLKRKRDEYLSRILKKQN